MFELEMNMDTLTQEAQPLNESINSYTDFQNSAVNDMVSSWNTEWN